MTPVLIYAAATIFGPASLDSGNPHDSLACARAIYGEPRRLAVDTVAVASYLWPCGTWLDVCAGDRCVRAQVLDRGPRRARLCLDRVADPKCSIPNPLRFDLDLSIAAGVLLGIGDATGRTTRACLSIHGRGCAVTYSIAEVQS